MTPKKIARKNGSGHRANGAAGKPIPFTTTANGIARAAERAGIKPAEPTTRDAMLEDALEVIDAARRIFYVQGLHNDEPLAILTEAMHSLEQDLSGISERLEACDGTPEWQELYRMADRARLARKLADFRRTYDAYRPTKTESKSNGAEVSS